MHYVHYIFILKGNFGQVYKANFQKHFDVADEVVAVKILPENETKSLDHEIKIMTKLKHKNIVQIIGYCFIGWCVCCTNFAASLALYSLSIYSRSYHFIFVFAFCFACVNRSRCPQENAKAW